jgi:glycosyltransferase involved in cell wall biosynthesis
MNATQQATTHTRPQVAVVYHFFPHYRRAIVEELARSTQADFTFIGDDHDRGYAHGIRAAQFSAVVKFILAPAHRFGGPFRWQWGAVSAGMNPAFDTVIFHAVPHWPCTWIGAIAARLLGKRVFFWGHGYLSQPRGLKGLFRKLFYAIPHQHMFYGRGSKQYAMEQGWSPEHLHVIYNSQDIAEQITAREKVSVTRTDQIRRELFGDTETPVVICTTRLIALRRLDLLIDAIAELKRRGTNANLIIVGDGEERAALEAQAAARGVRAHFEGACYNEQRIAELVMASNVTVAPGMVGLTAMHSMVYGVPVVTHNDADDQMPEWEAIIPGQNGSLFSKNNLASLADAIQLWLSTQYPTATTKDACHAIMDRFWNPTYQRRAIERAVCGEPADDLFDIK